MKYEKMLIILAAFATGFSTAHAAISAYEGFDYDIDSAVLQSQSGGFGWSDNWNTGNPTGDFAYNIVPGLSFGSLLVSGGAVSGQKSDGGNEHAGRALTIPLDGTNYISFLTRIGYRDNPSEHGVLIGGYGPNFGNAQFAVIPDSFEFNTPRLGGARVGNNSGNTSGSETATGEVYINLARATTGATQTIDYWTLTAAQFDNFKSGGLTDAELDAASVGTGPTQIFQKTLGASRTATPIDTSYANIRTTADGAGVDVVYDELRIGQSLDDVTPLDAAPLAISSQPVNRIVGIDGSTTLTVGASGPGLISYQWQVSTGGGFADLAEETPYSGVNGPTLTINPVTEAEAASYQVIVSNTVDTLTSQPVTVSIAGPPPISIDLYPGITVNGVVGLKYLIEYSTNMVDWSPLETINSLPSTPYLVIDSTPVSAGPKRFYRASLIL